MKELLAQRAKVFEQARALVLKAEAEKRALKPEEQTEYDARMADVKALGETIERSRMSAEMCAELDRSIGPRETADNRRSPGSDLADAAMDQFLRRGSESLSTEQRRIFAPVDGYRDGIQLRTASPLSDVTGAAGAYMVPQGFLAVLEQAKKWYGGMLQVGATVLRTATGASLPYPNLNDTGNVGELVAENTQVSQAATEMSFGRITLGAYKYSSKLVLVPIELIQDSAFDVQGLVANALGIRLGRIQNTHFTTGTGSSQPNGVVTAATSGTTGATGETAKWVYADIPTLIHSVDPAYRIGAKFMLNDASALVTELMVDGNGRPLLNSSFLGISQEVKAGDPTNPLKYSILGYPVVINNDVATMSANAKSVLFGDFSKYIIRQCLDFMLVRFGEKYMDYGQIGFVAFERCDGNLQDAGTHPIKYFANSAT